MGIQLLAPDKLRSCLESNCEAQEAEEKMTPFNCNSGVVYFNTIGTSINHMYNLTTITLNDK